MSRTHHCGDGSDHVLTKYRRPRRGRDGSDHERTNCRSRRGRDRPDHVDTRRGSHHGRGRSGSSSGSDRSPLIRKRSRTRRGSLAPLRGYCKVSELRKAEREKRLIALALTNAKEETRLTALEVTNAKEETRLTALELTKALEAETECQKTITDLANQIRSLTARNRSLSKELKCVSNKLALNQERSVSLTETHNFEQEQLERQLSVALQSTAKLQDWINELAQRSRSHELFDHCVRRTKSMGCENATGPDDISEYSSRSADDDSMAEPASVTLVPSQPRNQPEVVKETAVGTNGMQQEISISEQSEPPEQFGDTPGAEKDPEQPLPPDDSIGVAEGRSSMPSPCGEPRAFDVGDAIPKQSFQ